MKDKLFLLTVGAAIFSSVSLYSEPPAVRNVLVILMDDQGADLSLLGTKGLQTPNLDRLAAQGVYFSNSFAATSSCAPSRASILTGMWPHSNLHWRNTKTPSLRDANIEFTRESSMLDDVRIPESIPTIIEILRKNGFYTAITHKFHLSPPWKYPFERRDPVQNDPEQFHMVISEMIQEADNRPFFILANIEPPHRSFRYRQNFRSLFANGRLLSPDINEIEVPDYMPDIPKVREDIQEYYASIQVSDACAGAIIQALEESGRLDETLIIYTSDNGMPMYRAKASAYPAGTHMPLTFAGPGIESGRLCEHVVSLTDLMPTIMDALHLSIPPSVQGESLWSWLTGKGKLPSRDYVFMEYNSHGPDLREAFPQRAATDGRWYYILNLDPAKPQKMPDDLIGAGSWRNNAYPAILDAKTQFPQKVKLLEDMLQGFRPGEELYDLQNDQWAINNLANIPEYNQVLETLRNEVRNWRFQTNDINTSVLEYSEKSSNRVNVKKREYVTPLSIIWKSDNTGFRYVRIDLLGPDAEIFLKEVNAISIYRDIPYLGSFNSSDTLLNTIWQTGAYTLSSC